MSGLLGLFGIFGISDLCKNNSILQRISSFFGFNFYQTAAATWSLFSFLVLIVILLLLIYLKRKNDNMSSKSYDKKLCIWFLYISAIAIFLLFLFMLNITLATNEGPLIDNSFLLSIVIFIGAVFGATFGMFASIECNRKLLSKQIAINRQEWVNQLRKAIADYLALWSNWDREGHEIPSNEVAQMFALTYEIKLLLNSNDLLYAPITKVMTFLRNTLNNKSATINENSNNMIGRDILSELVQCLLKVEWERIKLLLQGIEDTDINIYSLYNKHIPETLSKQTMTYASKMCIAFEGDNINTKNISYLQMVTCINKCKKELTLKGLDNYIHEGKISPLKDPEADISITLIATENHKLWNAMITQIDGNDINAMDNKAIETHIANKWDIDSSLIMLLEHDGEKNIIKLRK